MKMLVAYWVLMRLLWRSGIAHSRRALIAVRNEVVVGDGDKIDDLIMNHDAYIVDLYRQAAKIDNLPLRDFLLKYGLAVERKK